MTKSMTKSEDLYDRLDKHFFEALQNRTKDVGLVVESLRYAYSAHARERELPARDVLDDYVSKLKEEEHYFPLVSALHTYFEKKVDQDITDLLATEADEKKYLGMIRGMAAGIKIRLDSGSSGLERFGCYGAAVKDFLTEKMDTVLTSTDEQILAEARKPYKDIDDGKLAFESLKMAVNYVLRGLRERN